MLLDEMFTPTTESSSPCQLQRWGVEPLCASGEFWDALATAAALDALDEAPEGGHALCLLRAA